MVVCMFGFLCVGVSMCGVCNVWVYVWFEMCGCVYV